MKIAIESNDGITIKSPFLKTKGYLVYEINESHINGYEYRKALRPQKADVSLYKNPHSALNDCNAIISRGMDRIELQSFKEEGKEVFITFKTTANDAAKLYIKELLINEGIHH
ncbi:MAG: hypothetical protein KJN64_02255 [Ignavibacteria bacterium]|nr:hypothetical protein [Ignavibacteria bacterium]MBT8381475.1 hypothetical protein [Ignavibacteria bacterium]MBT8391537.1 hypothetical protein [Ignavibacteria bacterium]NNJ52229.1 hypothetical protein [Ignavibacteriaceae bacterium]NNL22705.1 hypothetical protein [Ignavibacteriaceae bacterium]